MRLHALSLSAALLVAALGSTRAEAGLITYQFSGNATGSLDSSAFTRAHVVFTLVADSDNVSQIGPNTLVTEDTTLNFTVGRVSGTFDDPFHVFLFAFGPRPLVGLSPQSGDDLLDIRSSAFAGYDLRSPFGPVSQAPPDFINIGEAYATSAGDFLFTSESGRLTFRAVEPTAVPEPATMVSALVGAVGVAFQLRKPRRRGRERV